MTHPVDVRAAPPPSELIIGMDGFIGRHLCTRLPEAQRTSRRNANLESAHHFDLVKQGPLPNNVSIVYICAGVNGTLTCMQNPQLSWRANVDGTIYIAEHYRDIAHVVWIGSTTAEWMREDYGIQKRATEMYLRGLPHVGIVRAGRVMNSNVDNLCDLLIDIGRKRKRGVFLWNVEEKPYAH